MIEVLPKQHIPSIYRGLSGENFSKTFLICSFKVMSYADDDIEAAIKYAEYNTTIRLLNAMLIKAPHLTSHLQLDIRDATDDDFYIPASLQNKCKIIKVSITEKLCEKLNCQSNKADKVCKPTEEPSYFRRGVDGYGIQCNPACFHLMETTNVDDEGQPVAHTLPTNFTNNSCRLSNPATENFLTFPFYRSKGKYEARVNNLEMGYSLKYDPDDKFGDGKIFVNDKGYCAFFREELTDDGDCTEPKWMTVVDAIIGANVVNLVRDAVDGTLNTGDSILKSEYPSQVPANKPPTVQQWKNDIDINFSIPPFLDPPNTNNEQMFKSLLDKSPKTKYDFRRRKEAIIKIGILKNNIRSKKYNKDDNNNNGDGGDEDNQADLMARLAEMLSNLPTSLAAQLKDPKFLLELGIGVLSDVIIEGIADMAFKLAEKLTGDLLEKLTIQLANKIGSKIFSAAVSATIKSALGKIAFSISAKIATFIAECLGSAATIVGTILLVIQIFDIILAFWDPTGYGKLYPKEIPGDIAASGAKGLRVATQTAIVNLDFEYLATKILTSDELTDIHLESMSDQVLYLSQLKVNAYGSVIDQGEPIDFNGGSMNVDPSMVSPKKITLDPDKYQSYNENFLKIISIRRYIFYSLTISATLMGISMLTKMYIMCFIFLIILLIIVYIYYLTYTSSYVIDMYEVIKNGYSL